MKARLRNLLRSILFGWLVLMVGCQAGEKKNVEDGRWKIVCTTGQVGDLLRNIGGQHVVVTSLMGPGVDPHLYKATPGDSRQLKSADLVFFSGLHLEGRLAALLENLAEKRPVFAVTDALTEQDGLRSISTTADVHDPHVWFDVALWTKCVRHAAEKLIEHDPANADDYRNNTEAYVAKLETLDQKCRESLATIPESQRVLVTAHDAFGYFGEAYGVEVHGLQGVNTSDEADLGSINKLVELLVSRKIKAVFVESSVPPKNIQALIEGCQARGHDVRIGGDLYSDALGPANTSESTYIGVVEHNVKTIVAALK